MTQLELLTGYCFCTKRNHRSSFVSRRSRTYPSWPCKCLYFHAIWIAWELGICLLYHVILSLNRPNGVPSLLGFQAAFKFLLIYLKYNLFWVGLWSCFFNCYCYHNCLIKNSWKCSCMKIRLYFQILIFQILIFSTIFKLKVWLYYSTVGTERIWMGVGGIQSNCLLPPTSRFWQN